MMARGFYGSIVITKPSAKVITMHACMHAFKDCRNSSAAWL